MLFRQTLLYLPAQVLGPLVQFISAVLWTYFLVPQEMGIFALISAVQEFAYIGTMFWFTLYTMRYFDKAATPDAHADFLNTEGGVMLGSLAASMFAVALLPFIIDAAWTPNLFAATLAYCVPRSLATHLTDRARTAGDTLTYTVLQISWPVLGLLIGLVFVNLFAPVAANVLWGYAVAQILALGFAAWRIDVGSNPFKISKERLKIAFRYGMPLVLGGLFVWLANNGIRFVVEHREGASAVGLVTVGWGLGLRAAAFAAMLVTAAAFPLAVARSREQGMAEGQMQLVRNGILLLAVLAPAAAGLWAISAPLVERIVAEPFREMTAVVLPWAILAGAARNMRIHFGEQVFLLREETMVPLGNDILDGLSTILCGAIGLAMFGLPGSIIGAAVGALVSLAVTLAFAAYWHRFSFPLGHLMRIGAATALMVAVLSFVPIAPTTLSLAAAICIGGLVYGAAMALFYPEGVTELIVKLRGFRQA